MRRGWSTRRSPHHPPNVNVVADAHKPKERFPIVGVGRAERAMYSLRVSAEKVPELAAVLKKSGRPRGSAREVGKNVSLRIGTGTPPPASKWRRQQPQSFFG